MHIHYRIFLLLAFVLFAMNAFASSLDDGKKAFSERRYDNARAAFLLGWQAGDATAGYLLARMLELGLGGAADKIAARTLYEQVGARGETASGGASLNRLALMYYHGEAGLSHDDSKARKYFQKSIDAGDKNASFNLGKMYFEGRGGKRNLGRAIGLYRRAAEKDHIAALNTLGALYKAGAKNAADREASQRYYARSAAFGNAVGLYEHGLLALEGAPKAAQIISAHRDFNLAAVRGHPKAKEALQQLTALMQPGNIEQAQAAARHFKAQQP